MRNLILIASLLLPTTVSAQENVTGFIEGWIVDGAAGSIDGVQVSASNRSTSTTTTASRDGGRFKLELPPGWYQVSAELPGFRKLPVNVLVEPRRIAVVPILLQLGGLEGTSRQAEGRVLDPRGRGVEGAHVTAVLPTAGDESPAAAVTTDRDGRFRLPVDGMATMIIVAIAEGRLGAAVLPFSNGKTQPPLEIRLHPLTNR
jgi:hypothetical protein